MSLCKLILLHAERLGVDPQDALENALVFARLVGQMENGGRLIGSNPYSSAKGLYQFTDGTIPDALRRLRKYVDVEMPQGNINGWDWASQTLLFLGNILEKVAIVNGRRVPGLGDKMLREALGGSRSAMASAYAILHHTNVDQATKRRMEVIFGRT